MSNSVTLPPNGYTITFISAICNPDNTQTWTYSITGQKPESGQDISNWALDLCDDPKHQVIGSTGPPNSQVDISGRPCLAPAPGDNTNAIKWENLDDDNVQGEYTFTLQGCFEETDVQVAVKAGEPCYFGTIIGPSCEALTPPTPPPTPPPPPVITRGVRF